MIYLCPYCRVGKKENRIIMIPKNGGFTPMCTACFKKFKKERKAISGIR